MPVTKTSALPATTAAAAAASPATTAAAAAALLHNHAQKHMKQHTVCLCTRIYNMNATPFSAWLISKHQLMIVRWAQVASLLLLVHIFRPHSFGTAYQLTSLLMLLATCIMILAGQKGQHLRVSNELRLTSTSFSRFFQFLQLATSAVFLVVQMGKHQLVRECGCVVPVGLLK
jgi:hypothetical protein